MLIAGLFWIAVFVYLLRFDHVPLRLMLGPVFFIAFFGLALAYYGRTAIFVDAGGLTYRGLVKTRRVGYEEIRNVDVLPGLVTVYAIAAPAARLFFTSLFAHHRRLAELLVERAGLQPQHGV